jgi:hypothetical protein
MPLDSSTQKPPSRINYWFYLTMLLIALLISTGVGFVAYSLGEQSVSTTNNQGKQNNIQTTRSSAQNRQVSQIENAKSDWNSSGTELQSNGPSSIESQPRVVSQSEQVNSKTISGQVFVVTKGRENIKLALVKICAVREDFILSWVNNKKNNSISKMQEAEKKINAVKQQIQKIEFEIQSTPSGEYGYSEAKYQLEMRKISLESELSLAKIRRDYWKSSEYFLEGLSQCEVSTKTDADGKYILTLPSNAKFAIAAETSRKVFDSSETYWWLVWAERGGGGQQLDLTNDNLMSSNPINGVVRIERY